MDAAAISARTIYAAASNWCFRSRRNRLIRASVSGRRSLNPCAIWGYREPTAMSVCARWSRRLGLAESVLDQFPAELSAGQQQRVGIGRAIVTRPRLIVLDEPTSALDPTARAEIVDLLRRLQHELGTAYLFHFPRSQHRPFLSAIGSRCSISGRLWKRLIRRGSVRQPAPSLFGWFARLRLAARSRAQTVERNHA